MARERDAAFVTGDAVIRAVNERISVVIDKDMAIDNKMPIGGEASLSVFAERLLAPDIAACFGPKYETMAAAALEMETWSHALQQFRGLAFAVQQSALAKSEDDTQVIAFISERDQRPPTVVELHNNMACYRRDLAVYLTLEGTRQYQETLASDLKRVQDAVGAARNLIDAMHTAEGRAK